MENKTAWDSLSPENQQAFIMVFEATKGTPLEIKPPAPEKWTVERVINEVKPLYYNNQHLQLRKDKRHTPGDFANSATERDAEKCTAFTMLLNCAYWANNGETKNVAEYGPWSWSQLVLPFSFTTKFHYDKFLSIEGIEDLLKTFFGK